MFLEVYKMNAKRCGSIEKAIEAYNEANQTDVTVATVKEIVARAKSTVDDRTILSGVHYKINEIAPEDIVTNQFP